VTFVTSDLAEEGDDRGQARLQIYVH
jgi:hypothetical protein